MGQRDRVDINEKPSNHDLDLSHTMPHSIFQPHAPEPRPERTDSDRPAAGRTTHSRRALLRLLRGLHSSDVPRLFDREDLWMPAFASLYQSYCDEMIFSEPLEGLRLASLGVMLAERIDDPDILARAYAIVGSGLRARDRLWRAEGAYRKALSLVRTDLVRADILQRFARLLTETGRGRQGLRAADEALAVFRRNPEGGVPDAQSEATGLVIRGWIHQGLGATERALDDFGAALSLADPVREPRTHDSALQNTAYLVLCTKSIERLGSILEDVRILRQRYARSRHRVVPRYMLLWIEGLIHWRFGHDNRAEALLIKARKGLAGKGAPSSVLQVSLELLRFYLEAGKTDLAMNICGEMLTIAPMVESGTEIVAMLQLLESGSVDADPILLQLRSQL